MWLLGKPKPEFKPEPEREDINITFPQALSFGIACQIDKSLTVSFDMGWVDWSEWILEEQDGKKYRPIGYEVPAGKKINDTYSFKAGIEYLKYYKDKIILFRAGLFYDQKPALDDPIKICSGSFCASNIGPITWRTLVS